MENLEWYFELLDHVTPTAKQMSNALKDVHGQMAKLDKEATKKQKSWLDQWSEKLSEVGSGLDSFVLGPLQKVIGIGAGVAGVVGGIVAQFASASIEALGFRDTTLASFRVMFGSAEKAQQHFRRATELALQTPFDTRQAVDAYRSIASAGFAENEFEGVFALISDMASASGNLTTGLTSASLVLSQIRSNGRLMGNDWTQLANLGLGKGILSPFIAARMGLRATGTEASRQVARLSEQGRISSTIAFQAIQDAIQARGGGSAIGTLTRSIGTGIEGQLSNIKDAFMNLVSSIDIDQTPGLVALRRILTDIASALNPATENGQKMRSVFIGFFNDFGALVANVNGSKITGFVGDLINLVTTLKPVFAGFGKSFLAFYTPFAKWFLLPFGKIIAFVGLLGNNTVFIFFLKQAGSGFAAMALSVGVLAIVIPAAIGVVIGVVFMFFDVLTDLVALVVVTTGQILSYWGETWDSIRNFVRNTVNFFGGLAVEFFNTGVNIIKAFGQGIANGATIAYDQVTSMGNNVLNRVKGIFRIASPSREMMELGGYVSEGFAMGIDSGVGDVQASLGNLNNEVFRMSEATISIENNITVNTGNTSDTSDSIANAVAEITVSRIVNALAGQAIEAA